MKTLKDVLQEAERDKVAVGHFNFSGSASLVMLDLKQVHKSWVMFQISSFPV